ncbi:MAG TPA: hypothetical protein DCR14_21060 [Acidimicrobiaceae bacterium]|nr:hypothetical protein [Acidimicrobiaceae bacterium]
MRVECTAAPATRARDGIAHLEMIEDGGGGPVGVPLPGIHHAAGEQPGLGAGCTHGFRAP